MTDLWNWLANAALALLLTVALVMAFRIDRALRVIRRDRSAFETLISNLSAATASVKSGIQTLRSEAERAAEQIERRTMEADKMATDLSFLIESADRVGARLEQSLRSAPGVPRTNGPTTTPVPTTDAARAGQPRQGHAAGVPPALDTAPGADQNVPFTGPSGVMEPSSWTEWPEDDGQAAAGMSRISPAASLGDLREMAGITTRPPRRPDNARAHAGTDVAPASIKQTG